MTMHMSDLTSLANFLCNEVFDKNDDIYGTTTDDFSCHYHNFENCENCLWVMRK